MTTDFADVTVIMPAYRAETTIGRALSSVAAQTLKPRAVVVVDDGSNDATTEAAEACRDALEEIDLIVIRQNNQGAGAARNRALAESNTVFVAFLDADDEWMPEKIARIMPHFANAQIALVAHDLLLQTGTKEQYYNCARHAQSTGSQFAALFRRGFIGTSTVVARREDISRAGGFDETLRAAQDYDLWLKIAAGRERPFVILPEALSRCHVVPGSITSDAERRRRCGSIILHRHLPSLRETGGFPFGTALQRTAVIAYEAAHAHRHAGRSGAALWSWARLPFDLITTTAAYLAPHQAAPCPRKVDEA